MKNELDNTSRKELVDEITKLTEEWYLLIGKDHHKDRDCHWYIEAKWSYGYNPVYTIQHFGYVIHPDIEIEFSSYDRALKELKTMLTLHIAEEKHKQKEREKYDSQN